MDGKGRVGLWLKDKNARRRRPRQVEEGWFGGLGVGWLGGDDSGSVVRLRLALHSFTCRELSYNYLSACNRSAASTWLRLTRLRDNKLMRHVA